MCCKAERTFIGTSSNQERIESKKRPEGIKFDRIGRELGDSKNQTRGWGGVQHEFTSVREKKMLCPKRFECGIHQREGRRGVIDAFRETEENQWEKRKFRQGERVKPKEKKNQDRKCEKERKLFDRKGTKRKKNAKSSAVQCQHSTGGKSHE